MFFLKLLNGLKPVSIDILKHKKLRLKIIGDYIWVRIILLNTRLNFQNISSLKRFKLLCLCYAFH